MNWRDWLGLVLLLAGVMVAASVAIVPAALVQSTDFTLTDIPGQFVKLEYANGRTIYFRPKIVNSMEYRDDNIDTGKPAVKVTFTGGGHRVDVADREQGEKFIRFIAEYPPNQ